jgi:hypothetical protein
MGSFRHLSLFRSGFQPFARARFLLLCRRWHVAQQRGDGLVSAKRPQLSVGQARVRSFAVTAMPQPHELDLRIDVRRHFDFRHPAGEVPLFPRQMNFFEPVRFVPRHDQRAVAITLSTRRERISIASAGAAAKKARRISPAMIALFNVGLPATIPMSAGLIPSRNHACPISRCGGCPPVRARPVE